MCGGKSGSVFVQKHSGGEVRTPGLDEKLQQVDGKLGLNFSREGDN